MSNTTSLDTINTYRDTLYEIAKKLKTLSDTADIEELKKLNNEISETLPIIKEIDNIGTELTKPVIDELKTSLENLVSDIQNKLDTDFFKGDKGEPFTYQDFTQQQIENLKVKGDPFTYQDFTTQQLQDLKGDKGTSITNVKNQDGKLIIEDSENKQYDLGNFVNNYNNLINKIDYETGSWTPIIRDTNNNQLFFTIYDARYIKIGHRVTCTAYLKDFDVLNNDLDSTALFLFGFPFAPIAFTHLFSFSYNSLFDCSVGGYIGSDSFSLRKGDSLDSIYKTNLLSSNNGRLMFSISYSTQEV